MNRSCGSRFRVRAALCSLLVGMSTSSCVLVSTLPSGPITISGEANDAAGLPLPNITVRLFRGLEYVETKTSANGAYAFASLAPDSYRLRPRLEDCEFLPDDVDLDHITSSTTQNFGGFGPGCGGQPTVNMGATTGPLTISGHIRDASGQAIVGARVDLRPDFGDDTRGIRFTDLTGGYSFHAKKGDYKLRTSGACSFAPGRVDKDDVKANVMQDFTAGPGCVTASKSNVTATGSVLTVSQGGVVLGVTYVNLEQHSTPGDALARLSEIAAEQPAPSRPLTIAGNPAIERQALITLPGPEIAGKSRPEFGPFLALTTAIAVGPTVVRFESQLSGQADPATIARFLQVARNFTPEAMPDLHGAAPTLVPMTKNSPPGPPPSALGITAPGLLAPGTFGELEIAASDTANAIVYGTQNGPFVSTNGGQTIKASTYNTAPAPPNAAFASNGDPSVAVGSPNAAFQQNIYFAQLQTAAPTPVGGTTPVIAIGLYQSTDNGQAFNLNSFPVNCNNAAAGCVVPDQEHLIADRVNRAVTPTGNFDQLYLAWRNYTSQTNNAHTIAVACSLDGGANWATNLNTLVNSGGDFARLSVGPDGSLLVAYSVISSATYALTVQKFTSCANGFQPAFIKPATVVKSVTEVTDMPGVDRQVQGNYSAAFDDSDGSAQTVFMVYSNETSAGNDDIHVAESRDGGSTWTRDSIVSTNGNGRKYFPWVCSTVGKKFVTWYDRRNSSAANPDLTAYFRSSVFDNGSSSSVGIGPELNVSGVNDPQCAPGLYSGVRGAVEETGCNNLPAGFIQGGTCQATCAAGAVPPCGSGTQCDFRVSPPCAALPPPAPPETCTPAGGVPKYGDYNGAACALGTLFMAWASATPPTGAVCIVNGLPSPSAAQCCSGIRSGGTCAPSAATCTANGGACGPGLQACCSAGATGQCEAGTCMPVIAMYTGSSCIGPGCAGLPVTITYHQTGACNGYVTGSGYSAGPNQAMVIFGIERIDNSGGSASFAFDPAKLYVQQATQDFIDSSLSVYADIFGPLASVPTTLTPGQDLKFSVVGQGALVVSTTTTDGAVEANQTAYFLHYNRAPTDPQITLVKSDASRTSWPLTQDCLTITLN
jgi:hypothetical protein